MKNLVILGAGTAGTIMLNKMRKTLAVNEWNITIIDKDNTHYYQPGFLFIPFGMYAPKDVVRKKSEFFPKNITSIIDTFKKIDTDAKKVILSTDKEINYDILIIATGCDISPDETPGLSGDLWYKKIFDFYTFEGSCKLTKALADVTQGNVVIHVTEMPIKCPVAPLEFTFLADAYFRKKGIRDKINLTYITPLPGAFTKPKCTEALDYMLKQKNINILAEFNVECIDEEKCEIVSYDETRVPFDLLVTIPTNMGASEIEDSSLGDELNFVPTDKHTLQSKDHKEIFVIGDATDVPASKAGSVAHFQADILTENIISFIAGEPLTASFDGHANCFIESGNGKALLIDFNYEVEPLTGHYPLPVLGPMSLLKETRLNHFGKLAFRWVYWNMLLRGVKIPFIGSDMTMTGKVKNN